MCSVLYINLDIFQHTNIVVADWINSRVRVLTTKEQDYSNVLTVYEHNKKNAHVKGKQNKDKV